MSCRLCDIFYPCPGCAGQQKRGDPANVGDYEGYSQSNRAGELES